MLKKFHGGNTPSRLVFTVPDLAVSSFPEFPAFYPRPKVFHLLFSHVKDTPAFRCGVRRHEISQAAAGRNGQGIRRRSSLCCVGSSTLRHWRSRGGLFGSILIGNAVDGILCPRWGALHGNARFCKEREQIASDRSISITGHRRTSGHAARSAVWSAAQTRAAEAHTTVACCSTASYGGRYSSISIVAPQRQVRCVYLRLPPHHYTPL